MHTNHCPFFIFHTQNPSLPRPALPQGRHTHQCTTHVRQRATGTGHDRWACSVLPQHRYRHVWYV
ncbi:hypothetical protein EON63_21060 [archaeon]|nr:MAG: hypothetical protein EON63_21060 [archaeon]